MAYPIQIRWRSEDVITATATPTISESGGTQTSKTEANTPGARRLSDGAIVGIALSIFLALCLICVTAVVFVVVRRRRRTSQGAAACDQSQGCISPDVSQRYSSIAAPQEMPTGSVLPIQEIDGRAELAYR